MAMDAGNAACTTGLSAVILGAFVSSGLTATAALKVLCHALAEAIVDEIVDHAVVNPTLLVAPSGGGPVTGTGTIS